MAGFALAVLLGLGSILLIALAVAGALVRWGGWEKDHGLALATGLAVTPTVTGLLAWPLLATGLGGPTLAAAPGLAAILLLLLSRSTPDATTLLVPLKAAPGWLRFLLVVLAITMTVQAVTIAISESDALDYVTAGRIIARDGGLAHYPFLAADPTTGFYAPSIHPPTFHLLIAWVVASTPDGSLLVLRLASVMTLLATALLVAHLIAHRAGPAPALAALLVLVTPVLVTMGLSFNSDAIRIAAVVAALASVMVTQETGRICAAVAAGLLAGFAMWAHSAGLIAPAIGLAVLMADRRRAEFLPLAATYAMVAGAFGGGWYALNILKRGVVITDSWPAAEWPSLSYGVDMLARRGLDTTFGMVTNGALQAFLDPALMGFAFWLAIMGMAFGAVRLAYSSEKIAVFAVGGFLIAALAMAALGQETIIKNVRYVMTVAPMAALLGGVALAAVIERRNRLASLAAFFSVSVAVWVLAGMALRSYGLSSMAPVLGVPESWAMERDRLVGGHLLRQLEKERPGVVLTFRQPDMAHLAGRAWLDHFDPRLADVHTGTVAEVAAALHKLGVRFAYVPAQTPVTMTRSALGTMLADPRYARPLAEHRGVKLFAVEPAGSAVVCQDRTSVTALSTYISRGFADVLADISKLPQLKRLGGREPTQKPALLPATVGEQGSGLAELRLTLDQPKIVHGALRITLSGASLFEIEAEFADASGRSRRQPLLNGLSPDRSRELSVQAKADPGENLSAFVIKRPSGTSGTLLVVQASICEVKY